MIKPKHKDKKQMTGNMWRMVYYQGKVIALIEGKDDTVTEFIDIYGAVEYNNENQALQGIDDLGLEYNPT